MFTEGLLEILDKVAYKMDDVFGGDAERSNAPLTEAQRAEMEAWAELQHRMSHEANEGKPFIRRVRNFIGDTITEIRTQYWH